MTWQQRQNETKNHSSSANGKQEQNAQLFRSSEIELLSSKIK